MVKETLLKLYISYLNKANKSVFILQPEAFMQAVFLGEKTKFKKNKLLHWYEFTDPTSTLAILVYNANKDPFVSFDYDEEIPNPVFRAQKPDPALYGIVVRGVHLMNSEIT